MDKKLRRIALVTISSSRLVAEWREGDIDLTSRQSLLLLTQVKETDILAVWG
jgi:hypothetical protein